MGVKSPRPGKNVIYHQDRGYLILGLKILDPVGEVSDLHVYIGFWVILSIIFFFSFSKNKKNIKFPERLKRVAVGVLKKFFTPSPNIERPMTTFVLCSLTQDVPKN